jgi:hypothetical protein
MFVLHLGTMTALLIACLVYAAHNGHILKTNWDIPFPE